MDLSCAERERVRSRRRRETSWQRVDATL